MVLLHNRKGKELWLMLIDHISKRNDSLNIIIFCTLHVRVIVLFNLSLLGSANILELLVKQKSQ